MAVELDTPQGVALEEAHMEALIADIRSGRRPAELPSSLNFADAETRQGTIGGGIQRTVVDETRGRVTLYDTRTGVPSEVLISQLAKVLGKRRPDGQRVFSERQTVVPKRGTFKCHLHPEHEMRALYDSIGLADKLCDPDGVRHCATFQSDFDVMLHMQRKHKTEWQVIKDNEEKLLRAEERENARITREAMISLAAQNQPRRRRSSASDDDGGEE